jgi:hypothetical protein
MANPLSSQEPAKEEWLISAPAFSVTKVQATIGVFITAVLGAVPASLGSDRSVVIAAIAAGTLIMLGVLALVAVDMRTRQRAHEAKLRFGNGGSDSAGDLLAVPAQPLRVMKGSSDEEYDVDMLKVADGKAQLVATRDGGSSSIPFNTSK